MVTKAKSPLAAPGVSESVDAPVEGVTAADTARARSAYVRQRDFLKAQPKVRIRVPEDTFVQINGYGFHIAKKQWVEVPEQVAEILAEAGRI